MKKRNGILIDYALAELAGDIFSSLKLTAQQEKEAKEQLAEARKKSQEEMSAEERMELKLFQLQIMMEDRINPGRPGAGCEPEAHQ
jgi:t-SNARE complex subunit (syntaxin)